MNQLTTISHLCIPLLLILISSINVANATPESNRVVRCFFQNLGGCNNHNGSCRRFCVDQGCNLAQRDFCERQGFPADDRRRQLYVNQDEYEAATSTSSPPPPPPPPPLPTVPTVDPISTDPNPEAELDNHGIDFNMTNIAIPPECMSQSYDLHLVVAQGHLFLSALPSSTSATTSSACPSLVASTVYGENDGHPTKQLASIGPELVEQVQQKALFLASLELHTIQGAFQNAVVSTAASEANDTWHLMENNCSVFVMSMLQQLGINYDSEIIRLFVRAELMQSENIMTMVERAEMAATTGRNHENRLLRGGVRLLRNLMGEREMVDRVIDHNIQHFQSFMSNGRH